MLRPPMRATRRQPACGRTQFGAASTAFVAGDANGSTTHAAARPAATGASGGTALDAARLGERAARREGAAGRPAIGRRRLAADDAQSVPRAVGSGRLSSRLRVYGWRGAVSSSPTGPDSTMRPA